MRIMQSYTLLGGEQFMSMYCPAIVAALEKTIGRVADQAALPAIDLLDLCIQVFREMLPRGAERCSAFQRARLLLSLT